MYTHSFIQTNKVPTTLPVLSIALYVCLTSSVNASAVTPNAPVVAASNILPFLFGSGIPVLLVEY